MIKFERIPTRILSRMPAVREALFRAPNVVFGYLFGGLASGREDPLSDVDIAVYVNDIRELAEFKLALFDSLTDALGTTELDLVVLNTAPVSIAGRVLLNKQLLVDKEPFKRHAFESLIRREFFDFRVQEEAFFSRRYGFGR